MKVCDDLFTNDINVKLGRTNMKIKSFQIGDLVQNETGTHDFAKYFDTQTIHAVIEKYNGRSEA